MGSRPKASRSKDRCLSSCRGFTSKKKGAGRCHVCDQDFPNKSVCTDIIEYSHSEFSMVLVALNSLHMFCRDNLCREHIWGFHTSDNPSYSSKVAHWHSGAWIIVLNPINLGRKVKYGPINSDARYLAREGYSSTTAAEGYTYSPTTWHVCGGVQLTPPSVQDCIPLCIWIPLSVCCFHCLWGSSGLFCYICVTEDPGILVYSLQLMPWCATSSSHDNHNRNKWRP